MGFFSTILGFCGFGVGISTGLVIGYYIFIYFQPCDVKNPVIRPLAEQDTQSLQRLLHEIPLWVKNPDYDRGKGKEKMSIQDIQKQSTKRGSKRRRYRSRPWNQLRRLIVELTANKCKVAFEEE